MLGGGKAGRLEMSESVPFFVVGTTSMSKTWRLDMSCTVWPNCSYGD